ncbi:DnaJ domain-containing protein [Novispirillum sp. DQ9]|uniref:DnaJ domain-containing protein n=1 Tax=Novispirillum sp. DQ9 TaxID=3398612 RepID=UPI003C7A604A
MAYPPSDPSGYYRTLGVVPQATAEVIKAAYRRRAKDLHPDRNPRPDARDEFQRLGEAYRTLSDPARRAAYDAGRLKAAAADPEPYRPHACCACGKTAAQPRFVVFPTVQGQVVRSVVGSVEGVFCRRCADATALRLALRTWLTGWWSIPLGPFHTLRALAVLLAGGYMPRQANHALLLRQARAFLLRGDEDVARGLALQALSFATTDEERRHTRAFAAATSGDPKRILRDRWHGASWLRLAQGVPLATLAAAGLAALALWTDVNLWGAPRPPMAEALSLPPVRDGIPGLERPFLLRNGHLYEVTRPALPLRSGPGTEHEVIAELDAGTVVMVSDNAPGGGWVRVFLDEDRNGFVSGRYLTPSLPGRGLDGSFPDNR